MRKVIIKFDGNHRFLSNFHPSPMTIGEKEYPTVEHYFQASKALDPNEAEKIRKASTPGEAKKLGRLCELRSDWNSIKHFVMKRGVREKFRQNSDLAQQLKDTAEWELEEGNTWGDTYWGIDLQKGSGKNHLGKILMETRQRLIDNLI